MASTAITPFQTTLGLNCSGIKHTVIRIAPSLTTSGNSNLSTKELDVSKLVFICTLSPHADPQHDSLEVWTQSVGTDNVVTCQWTSTSGRAPLTFNLWDRYSSCPPSVLHYATEYFEGLKYQRAYYLKLRLFPPRCEARRMLTVPLAYLFRFSSPISYKAIEELFAVDGEDWFLKSRSGASLYPRLTTIATAADLMVQKPREALLYIIACCFPSFDMPVEELDRAVTSYNNH